MQNFNSIICVIVVFCDVVSAFAALHKPSCRPNPIAYPRLLKWDLPYGFVVRAAVPRAVLRPVAPLSEPDMIR